MWPPMIAMMSATALHATNVTLPTMTIAKLPKQSYFLQVLQMFLLCYHVCYCSTSCYHLYYLLLCKKTSQQCPNHHISFRFCNGVLLSLLPFMLPFTYTSYVLCRIRRVERGDKRGEPGDSIITMRGRICVLRSVIIAIVFCVQSSLLPPSSS